MVEVTLFYMYILHQNNSTIRDAAVMIICCAMENKKQGYELFGHIYFYMEY